MKFTPKYTVSYKGAFHKAGIPFEIDGKEAGEMARHGFVEMPVKTDVLVKPVESNTIEAQPTRKGGRPRKVSA